MKNEIKFLIKSFLPKIYYFYLSFKKKNYSDFNKVQETVDIYYKLYNYSLNLACPKTFYEKINYYKLFYFDSSASKYVDKINVKNLVNGFFNIKITSILAKFSNINDFISFINLTTLEKYVIKFSHIGGIFFFKRNSFFDKKGYIVSKKYVIESVRYFLKVDYYFYAYEWSYKDIEKFVFIEEMLQSDKDKGLSEYKFFCNFGDIKMINVVSGRQNKENIKEAFTDQNLKIIPCKQDLTIFSQDEIIKPICFDDMIKFCKFFSKNFPIVRIDFLYDGNDYWLCEFTFFDCAGFNYFFPDDMNLYIGNLFNIDSIIKK